MSIRFLGLATLAAVALTGCAASQINLQVKSPSGTNLGRPMYMLVRQVDPKQYANETYSEVAAKIGAPDPSVLQTAVIYPGSIQRFQIKAPKEGTVAISFLFTAPDGDWQLLLGAAAPNPVPIELAASRIQSAPSVNSPGAAPGEAPAGGAAPPGEVPKLPDFSKMALPKLPGS